MATQPTSAASGVDAHDSQGISDHAADLKAAGYTFAAQYIGIDPQTEDGGASVTPAQVQTDLNAGLDVVSIFETNGMTSTNFQTGALEYGWETYLTQAQGQADAAAAVAAAKQLGQVSGTAIYFAMDFDPASTDGTITEATALQRVNAYFTGVNAYLASLTSGPAYTVGVYGAGATLQSVNNAGLARYTWLSESTGWDGYGIGANTGATHGWSMIQSAANDFEGVGIDQDQTQSASFGGWGPTVSVAAFLNNKATYEQHSNSIGIADTVANIEGALTSLLDDNGSIAAVTPTDGTIDVSVATFQNVRTLLDRVVRRFGVTDTAADIASAQSTLSGDLHIATLTTTSNGTIVARSTFNADESLYLKYTVSTLSNGNVDTHFAGGSFFAGKAFTSFDNVTTASGVLVSQTLYDASGMATQQTVYNANGSLYLMDTIAKLSNGNIDYHYQGGSFFNGKAFTAFDNVTTASNVLLTQTLLNASGQPIQQTQFNANGSIYLQDNVTRPAAGQTLYSYVQGTFFTGKAYSSFENLATTNNVLLAQTLDNTDGSHTVSVPGGNLTLAASKNAAYSVSGGNDTIRFGATGFGADTFSGYKAGDIFSFSTAIFANYQALSQKLSGTSNAVITDAAGDTLTLNGVAKASVNSGMFAFA